MKFAAAAALVLFVVLTALAGDDALPSDPRARTFGAALALAVGIATLSGAALGAVAALCWVLRARVPTPRPATIMLAAVTIGLALAAPVRTRWPAGELGVGIAGAVPLLDVGLLALGLVDAPRFAYDRIWYFPGGERAIPEWEALGLATLVVAGAAAGAAIAAIVRNIPRPIDRVDARRRLQRIVFFIDDRPV